MHSKVNVPNSETPAGGIAGVSNVARNTFGGQEAARHYGRYVKEHSTFDYGKACNCKRGAGLAMALEQTNNDLR